MPKPSAIEQAIRYIKSNWRDGKSLKEVAKLFGIDSGNLERAFHHREGITVKQFVDRRRKKQVIALLKSKKVYGYEIGTILGFANDLAFYRWVKSAFGVSFATLRSQVRGKKGARKRDKKS